MLALPFRWVKVLLVLALFLGANQIEGHFVAPRVMMHSTHLSSLAVRLAILFGIGLFGLMDAYYDQSRPYRAVPAPTDGGEPF